MHTRKSNSKGFGLIAALIVAIVVVAIGGAGTYAYHREHRGVDATHTTPATNPYTGWKTYTDSTSHYSFKYPTGWTVATDDAQGISTSVRNPGNSVLVSYTNPFVKDGGTNSFYTVSTDKVTSEQSLTIVGGAFTANSLPSYWVVDSSLLNTYPLTVGQTSTFETAGYFSAESSSKNAQLTAYPVGKVFTTSDQAKTWFTSADAKAALLILESLTYQP